MAKVAGSNLRRRLYEALEPQAHGKPGLSGLNKLICVLILMSTGLAVVETERTLTDTYPWVFLGGELVLTAIFAAEYVGRVWVSAENPQYGPGLVGRLKYMTSTIALLDLVAFVPALMMAAGSETFLLRLIRLIRILRLARLGRFSTAIQYLGEAVQSRAYELGITVGIAVGLVVASSTLLYLVEGDIQPDAFGSIPRSMWWAIVTLTTVGYGDVYPITALGRIIAGITALAGIGLIAMPTGILASAFSDAVQRRKQDKSTERSR